MGPHAVFLLGALFHSGDSFGLNPLLNGRLEQTASSKAAPKLVDEKSVDSPSKPHRRRFLAEFGTGAASVISICEPALAADSQAKGWRSRTEGYKVQRSEREWAYVLSGQQYNVLRQGGTERPFSSVLESEKRPGAFVCAGCGSKLFESSAKFNSGTGWPSFASSVPGAVEVDPDANPLLVSAGLMGAELRCKGCGGHLGDLFNDGRLFVNTPAFETGKRHCIDGYALVFKPADGSEEVFGDTPPPKKA
mmetsp:Transcript_24716/g.55663  ORF Transcript_24716/g.55663 Transcript_24716/m.55663 type:complete len:249 (+) Transcript_24716:31-777(+)